MQVRTHLHKSGIKLFLQIKGNYPCLFNKKINHWYMDDPLSANDKSFKQKFVICPGCLEPVPWNEAAYCMNCQRYQSHKKTKLIKPGFLSEKNGDWSARIPWVQNRGMKVVKWACLFIGISFPLMIWNESGSLSTWKIQQYAQAGFAFFGFYTFLALWLNSTNIYITKHDILIRRGPVPVPLVSSIKLKVENLKRIDLYHLPGYKSSPETYPIYAFVKNSPKFFDIFSPEEEINGIEFYEFLRTLWDLPGDPENPDNLKHATRKEISREEFLQYETSHNKTLSRIYTNGIIIALMLNLPALYFIQEWKFTVFYWKIFSTFTLLIFLLFFFHHRRHLNFWTSKPLKENEKNAGFLAYLVISIISTLLITPVVMALVNVIRQ